jgi:hypothetical protein
VVQVTRLDRFVQNRFPLKVEVPVLEIKYRRTDQLVTEQKIVVHRVDDKRGAAREPSFKVVRFVEVWVRLIKLVLFTIRVRDVTNRELEIRVRFSAHIT